MQLLKLSETDKERAIKNLANLFRKYTEDVGIVDSFMSPDKCREYVEAYLKAPYITEKDLES